MISTILSRRDGSARILFVILLWENEGKMPDGAARGFSLDHGRLDR